MLNDGDSLQNVDNTKKDQFLNLISSIKVLVVDHKEDVLSYIADLLHSCSFEVTSVNHSGAALKLLSEKKIDFDLLLIDSDMKDVDVLTFLRLTNNMDILSVVMAEQDDDDALLLEAFKNGAFLVLKRPLTINAIRRLRQDIIRERMHKLNKPKNMNPTILKATNEEITVLDNKRKMKDRVKSTKQVRIHNFDDNYIHQLSDDDDDDDGDYDEVDRMKKKTCLEWTQELHEKFLNAISQLGEGRCYPREILKLMGVPGLTRMQVASHLQKCRREKWKAEKQRTLASSSNISFSSKGITERKFGCMPSLQIDQNNQDRSTLIGFNLSFNGWQTEANHMNDQTQRGLFGSSQKSVTPNIHDTQFPFGIGLGANQHEATGFGNRMTKTTNNYFHQPISGSYVDPGQGSDQHNFPSNPRLTTSEDVVPDFLKELEGNGPNENLISELFSLGCNPLMPNKDTTGQNNHI